MLCYSSPPKISYYERANIFPRKIPQPTSLATSNGTIACNLQALLVAYATSIASMACPSIKAILLVGGWAIT